MKRLRFDRSGLVIIALAVAAIGAAWFLSRGTDRLPPSRVGFDGLVAWLEADGIEAWRFRGGGTLDRETVGLRIWPIHDDWLSSPSPEPETDLDYVLQTAEIDQSIAILAEKALRLDTLVILPKWRTGMRLSGIAHETLLIPVESLTPMAVDLGGFGASRGEGFGRFPFEGLEAVIWAPQTIGAGGCVPLIGTRDAMLLGRCSALGTRFLLLADPDLLNNQGLRLGDNAEIARILMRREAGGRAVIYDTTQAIWARGPGGVPDRPPPDLSRLLEWPQNLILLAFLALAGLIGWRSAIRFGAAKTDRSTEPGRSKAVSIAAKGRLLRLAGHDAKLLAAWAEARCHWLATELMGPRHAPEADPVRALERRIGRRDPALAGELAAAFQDIASHRGSDRDLISRLDRFERATERILHDLGRASGARR